MSSLGDVVHALPALSDASRHGVTFDWVVEEAFAPVASRHPAVERILPIAWRRWRRNLSGSGGEMRAFLGTLREASYDLILDAQGLYKSALVAAAARGRARAGFSFGSAREGPAAIVYGRRIPVPVGGHAVDRLRELFARAMGYPLPQAASEFGIEGSAPGAETGRILLLHGTTWPSKHWPERMWRALAVELTRGGWQVELPWGGPAERERAERIAHGVAGCAVLPALDLDALIGRIASSSAVVGVDSGLAHLAAACGVPTLVAYGSTSAVRTGVRGRQVANLQSDLSCSPCLKRSCGYRGEPLSWRDEVVEPPCYAHLTPERIMDETMRLLEQAGGRGR